MCNPRKFWREMFRKKERRRKKIFLETSCKERKVGVFEIDFFFTLTLRGDKERMKNWFKFYSRVDFFLFVNWWTKTIEKKSVVSVWEKTLNFQRGGGKRLATGWRWRGKGEMDGAREVGEPEKCRVGCVNKIVRIISAKCFLNFYKRKKKKTSN